MSGTDLSSKNIPHSKIGCFIFIVRSAAMLRVPENDTSISYAACQRLFIPINELR